MNQKRAGFTEIINKRQERFVKTGEEVEEDMKSNTGKDIDQTLEDVKSTTGKEIGQTIKLTPSSERYINRKITYLVIFVSVVVYVFLK